MQREPKRPTVLTVAGSDSGAGAGIQADLRAFAALGAFGTTAITCVTAQNSMSVRSVCPVDVRTVAMQIRAVDEEYSITAVKTGMLYSADIVRAVARTLGECGVRRLVVDPVMVAGSGASLLEDEALTVLSSVLLPMASVIVPNVPESETLCGRPIKTLAELELAAHEMSSEYGAACVIKGGHLDLDGGKTVTDVLCSDGEIHVLSLPRIPVGSVHGTGCAYSAAFAVFLARGETIPSAATMAQEFVAGMIRMR